MYTIIPKVTFNELQEDVKRIMATVGLYTFEESFLAVDPDINPRITFRTLVERANATFSRHFPLLFIQRIYIQPNTRVYTFIDNFDLYLNGSLDASLINMIPDAVVSISYTPHMHAKWGSWFTYQPPYLIFKIMAWSGLMYAKTLCKYRIHFNPNNRNDDAIYYMEKATPIYDVFIKQLVYDIAYFLVTAKQNYTINELPIDVFSGLENVANELRSELETLYQENPRNYLLYY